MVDGCDATSVGSQQETCVRFRAPCVHFSAIEDGNRFDMRRVREHIHHAGRRQPESMLVHEHARIARQAAGMARDVHHALARRLPQPPATPRARPRAADRAIPCRTRASPRRSWSRSSSQRDWRVKNSAFAMPLRCALARARSTRPASPSTPTTCCARRASGSEKLPSPQNKSSTSSFAVGCEQLDCPLDHALD